MLQAAQSGGDWSQKDLFPIPVDLKCLNGGMNGQSMLPLVMQWFFQQRLSVVSKYVLITLGEIPLTLWQRQTTGGTVAQNNCCQRIDTKGSDATFLTGMQAARHRLQAHMLKNLWSNDVKCVLQCIVGCVHTCEHGPLKAAVTDEKALQVNDIQDESDHNTLNVYSSNSSRMAAPLAHTMNPVKSCLSQAKNSCDFPLKSLLQGFQPK